MLLFFTFIGALSACALPFIKSGDWVLAAVFFIIGNIGFTASHIFYDALLCNVSTSKKFEYDSALGYAFGYLGGGLLFLFQVILISYPKLFGLSDAIQATQVSFFYGWHLVAIVFYPVIFVC